MSGAINTVGKLFGSTPGRVLTGVATGGASELGRAAAGVARRSGVDPTLTAATGLLAGQATVPSSTGALGANNPASVGPAKSGGVAAASSDIQTTNAEAQREADAALGTATDVLAPPTPDELRAQEEQSRRRAKDSADRLGTGRRRSASATLTALGGA